MSGVEFPRLENKQSTFLHVERLEPGDVILSHTPGILPLAVQLSTVSPFTHAALVISHGMWFESTRTGVHYRQVFIHKVENHPYPEGSRWLGDICEYEFIAVYRHPQMRAALSGQTGKILDVVDRYFGMQYPPLARLASTVPKLVRPQAERTLRVTEELIGIRQPINPGTFCSEMIASVFRDLGLALFETDPLPNEVSPGALAYSNLRQQDMMFCKEDESIENDYETCFKLNSMPSAGGAVYVALHALVRQCLETGRIADKLIEGLLSSQEPEDNAIGLKLLETMVKGIRKDEPTDADEKP